MQRWDASIAASVGIALLVQVTIFLSLAPDIVWRDALEAGRSHRESRRRETECVGTCSDGQLRSGFAKMQGWPAENAPLLPLECSVRGGEARDAGAHYTRSGTTCRGKKRKWALAA